MKLLLLVLLYFSSISVFADSERQALKTATKAVSEIPEVKEKMKYFERLVFNRLPIEKETAGVVGGVGLTLVEGRVNTKVFKNLDIDFFGGTLRPDFEYDFRDETTSGFINCSWDINKITD